MTAHRSRGQSLVEFALVAPLVVFVLAGIIILGVGVFYQAQLFNAAREAARYAAIHSATSQCPTTSNRDPAWNRIGDPTFDIDTYYSCDPPSTGWPNMTAHARAKVVGIDASQVHFAACWSGYWDELPVENWDAPAIGEDGLANEFHQCTIGGTSPHTDPGSVGCPPPATTIDDDQASNLSATAARTANQVTVYACYLWAPPFLNELLGGPIRMQAVVSEAMQHQR